jgi:hypothetical protein
MAGDPVDDDLDLLRDQDGDGPPKRRPWGLLAGALTAVLVAVAGLVWAVGSPGSDTEVRPAAASPSATTTAPEPTTTPPAPTTTVATPSATVPTIEVLLPPAASTPSPRPTATRRPTLPPLPTRPTFVRVPDVTGLRVPIATLTLRASGFQVLVPGGGVGPRPDERRVRAQIPAGGTLAPRGAIVTLVLDSS